MDDFKEHSVTTAEIATMLQELKISNLDELLTLIGDNELKIKLIEAFLTSSSPTSNEN